jgi:hypothetical protein
MSLSLRSMLFICKLVHVLVCWDYLQVHIEYLPVIIFHLNILPCLIIICILQCSSAIVSHPLWHTGGFSISIWMKWRHSSTKSFPWNFCWQVYWQKVWQIHCQTNTYLDHHGNSTDKVFSKSGSTYLIPWSTSSFWFNFIFHSINGY